MRKNNLSICLIILIYLLTSRLKYAIVCADAKDCNECDEHNRLSGRIVYAAVA